MLINVYNSFFTILGPGEWAQDHSTRRVRTPGDFLLGSYIEGLSGLSNLHRKALVYQGSVLRT